ncbi:hypothetical protein Tco_0584157 [Tanacetum coccineum]
MMDGGDDMVLMMMVRWRGDGGEGSVSGGHRRNLAGKVEAAPEMQEREERKSIDSENIKGESVDAWVVAAAAENKVVRRSRWGQVTAGGVDGVDGGSGGVVEVVGDVRQRRGWLL